MTDRSDALKAALAKTGASNPQAMSAVLSQRKLGRAQLKSSPK